MIILGAIFVAIAVIMGFVAVISLAVGAAMIIIWYINHIDDPHSTKAEADPTRKHGLMVLALCPAAVLAMGLSIGVSASLLA